MKKSASPFILFGWLLVTSLVSSHAQAGQEIGIDRSNLTRESEAVQEKTLQDIHALRATWFRDVLSGATPQGLAKFVHEVKLAKQHNLKFLANVLAAQADYDEGYQNQNAGEDFRKRCGWSQGSSKISQINWDGNLLTQAATAINRHAAAVHPRCTPSRRGDFADSQAQS